MTHLSEDRATTHLGFEPIRELWRRRAARKHRGLQRFAAAQACALDSRQRLRPNLRELPESCASLAYWGKDIFVHHRPPKSAVRLPPDHGLMVVGRQVLPDKLASPVRHQVTGHVVTHLLHVGAHLVESRSRYEVALAVDLPSDLMPHGARELVWQNLTANNH